MTGRHHPPADEPGSSLPPPPVRITATALVALTIVAALGAGLLVAGLSGILAS